MKQQILDCLQTLSKRRPLFYSEDDFKLALALEIAQTTQLEVRLEFPEKITYRYLDYETGKETKKENKPISIDLVVLDKDSVIPIELKYITKATQNLKIGIEEFNLKDQGARDVARYRFRLDIYRLLELVKRPKYEKGLAILLTNDNKLWSEPPNTKFLDGQFRLGGDSMPAKVSWNLNSEYLQKNYLLKGGRWYSKKKNNLNWIYGKSFTHQLNFNKPIAVKWEKYSAVGDHLLKYLLVDI